MKTIAVRIAAVSLAGLLGLGLAGCTSDDHGLPTLGGTTAQAGSDLEQAAKAYYDCMTDVGITVKLIDNGKGELTLVNFVGYDNYMYRTPNGNAGAVSTEIDPQSDPVISDFFNSTSAEPALILDGVDRSSDYVTCLAESGYDESAANSEYQMDPAQVAAQVEANNKWAACVRENGFPEVKDSAVPTVTDGTQWPTVILPGSITPDQLRQLLAACPNFDPAATERYQQWYADNPMASGLPPDYLPDPTINFDTNPVQTGLTGDYTPSPEEQAAMDKVSALYEVLWEASQAYYEAQAAGEGGGLVPATAEAAPR
ncbi:MAG: hypothetical protein LBI33_14025 [Propionibacteriaceae bacterium]|jgi:hypothetical protein|nr:hypothetical protein [Propionibacteriaceae bacterium]